jgi:hypothetical protein
MMTRCRSDQKDIEDEELEQEKKSEKRIEAFEFVARSGSRRIFL